MKRKHLLGLAAIIGIVVLIIFVRYFVEERPQVQKSMAFLQNSEAVIQNFGNVDSLELNQDDGEVTVNTDNTGGYYVFHIKGQKASGEVKILWTTTAEKPFEVSEIDRMNQSGGAVEIWKP